MSSMASMLPGASESDLAKMFARNATRVFARRASAARPTIAAANGLPAEAV